MITLREFSKHSIYSSHNHYVPAMITSAITNKAEACMLTFSVFHVLILQYYYSFKYNMYI